ncbi:hypothetical protein GQ457_14G010500 [Hibiscus cannabinus]
MPLSDKSKKFNVDGAVISSFEDVGIGGILRNKNRDTLIKIFKSVMKMDPTLTEIFIIKEAVFLFFKSCWAKSNTLLVETDNKLISEWIHNVIKYNSFFYRN